MSDTRKGERPSATQHASDDGDATMAAIDAETGAAARATKSVVVAAENQHEVSDGRENTLPATPKRRENTATERRRRRRNQREQLFRFNGNRVAVRKTATHLVAEINKIEADKACRSLPINFLAIKKTIRTFNGDDKGDIVKWISEFRGKIFNRATHR